MKTKIISIVVILLLCGTVFGGIYINQKTIDDAYNNAITFIQNGSYENALAELEKANSGVLDRDGFKSDMNYGSVDKTYKNTIPLYAYALAQYEYNSEDKSMYDVNEYLELISEDYNGELCEEIKTFKGNFKPQYEDFLIEEERKAEERRKKEAQEAKIREQEEAKRLKNSLPYVGLSESKINGTVLGTNYEIVHNSEYVNGEQIKAIVYRFKKGNGIIFVARCLNGRVDSVTDYRDDPWIIKSSSSSKKKTYHDTYDDGYEDVYNDGDYDWDRYDEDDDYARGVDDALDDWDEYGEDW